MGRGMSGNLNRGKRAMKPYGNVILMTLICIVIFWVFMALRPAHSQQFIGTRGAGVGRNTPKYQKRIVR
jgi:hypothetical protein